MDCQEFIQRPVRFVRTASGTYKVKRGTPSWNGIPPHHMVLTFRFITATLRYGSRNTDPRGYTSRVARSFFHVHVKQPLYKIHLDGTTREGCRRAASQAKPQGKPVISLHLVTGDKTGEH